ncbi:MAG: S1 RNA-binding domain-containing protein [Firmicutes bacterium]|jgi:S1 RNA binding domain protein|nr:S1 RNA-binding domain-containing protein [Bacillota bacterium]
MAIEVGSIVEGRVTGITNFGAFVELADGKTGLVHISEVADAYVKDINDYLKQNDRIKVKVININGNKIGLSIKQVNGTNTSNRVNRRISRQDFEDRLSKFLKDSEQRQQDLRKSQDSKRGGRGGPARF